MADTIKTKDSYAVLENEKEVTQAQADETPTPPVPERVKEIDNNQTIPVQNTTASVPDGVSLIDVVIKVIIDIIARLTGQKSPTGNKIPTAMVPQDTAKQAAKSLFGSVSGGLQKIGDSMEKMAGTAVNSAGSVVQKARDTAESSVNQAVHLAKEQTQGAMDAAKVAGQSTVNIAKDSVTGAVDTAKNAANSVKEVADTAVDSAKNVAHEAEDVATNTVDTTEDTVK